MDKICINCGELKFHQAKGMCNSCYNKDKYSKEKELYSIRNKEYKLKNREKVLKKKKEYHNNNREKILEQRRKKWNESSTIINLERRNQYKIDEEHRIKINQQNRNSYHKHAEKRNKDYYKNYKKPKYHSDPQFRIRECMSARIRESYKDFKLGKKNFSIAKVLGCDMKFFVAYIEKQFREGMTWENYGYWQLDHKVPCAAFDLLDIKQAKIAFHYSNYQPLWEEENNKKADLIFPKLVYQLQEDYENITGVKI